MLPGVQNPFDYRNTDYYGGPPDQTSVQFWPEQAAYHMRPDHWSWPWPVPVKQDSLLNCWEGNQLPGISKNPAQFDWLGWYVQTSQQLQEYQRAGDLARTGMSAYETTSMLGMQFASSRVQEGV